MRSLLFLIACVGIVTADVFRHDITLREQQFSPRAQLRAERNSAEPLREPVELGQHLPKKVLEWDGEMLVNITIGTPPQSFVVDLDTASSTLWVASTFCVNNCENAHKFDSAKSSSYVNNGHLFTVQTANNESVSGIIGTDTVSFAGSKQMNLVGVNFGMATLIPFLRAVEKPDGILGLGFPPLAADGTTSPLQQAIQQKLFDLPLFSIFVPTTTAGNNYQGMVTYGAIDTDNCGPIIGYQPLSSATYWQFQMSSIALGSYKLSRKHDVISDTRSPVIVGPDYIVDKIAAAIHATYDAFAEVYYLPCDAPLPTLDIKIGANTYSIQPENYLQRDGRDCIFRMYPAYTVGYGPQWVLGTPFLRQFCHVYDYGQQRIGFAAHKQ